MKICQVTPGLLPIPPNAHGAIEKLIWMYHTHAKANGLQSDIKYLDEVLSQYDVVHIHVANLALEASRRGLKYVFSLHDHHAYLYGKDSALYKENLEAIDKSIFSLVPGKFLIEYFDNHPKLRYFEHGVDTDYFKYIMPTIMADYTMPKHRLLCIANNGFANDQSFDRKGFSYAIEAAKRLNLPITIAGPSNNKLFFERYKPEYDKLNIIYDLIEEKLREVYQNHTIFLHPSMLEAGHPNLTLLEAMACGLPVVGTYEAGSKLSGLYIVERDVDQIVNGITTVIDNYIDYRQYALETAKEYSFNNTTKKLFKMYEEALIPQSQMKNDLIRIYETTPITIRKALEPTNNFSYTFVNGPEVKISGNKEADFKVQFIDKNTNMIHYESLLKNNHWAKSNRQYYINWYVRFTENGKVVSEHNLDLKDKHVYIAIESSAIGDTLAWFPMVEEFRKKHECKLTVTTFHNEWFEKTYPEITFAKPGETIYNLYAMYKIGWNYDTEGNVDYNTTPTDFKREPLQKTASSILGLEHKEIKPNIYFEETKEEKSKYVVIAPHASAHAKYWNYPGGWQKIINHIKKKGYNVIMLTAEKLGDTWHDSKLGGKLTNVIDKTGNHPIEERMTDIKHAKLFIGVGSGLSWISWTLGTKTIMISGFSYPYTEFSDCVRVFNNDPSICTGCFNKHRLDAGDWEWCPEHKGTDRHYECTKSITPDMVIKEIDEILAQ